MAKYSLWIADDNCNRFCVPLSRDGQNFKEKVELYEIDLLTVSLGRQGFIQALQNSHIAPIDFNWNSVIGCILYRLDGENKRMPLLFEKDNALLGVLNFYNKYCYHQKQTATTLQNKLLEPTLSSDFEKVKSLLMLCRDQLLEAVTQNSDLLDKANFPKEFKSKIHSYMQSVTYDEKVEYKNDLLKKMFSYINFRRVKVLEYGCSIEQKLVDQQSEILEVAEEEIDPDRYAFLTDDERAEMEGYVKRK